MVETINKKLKIVNINMIKISRFYNKYLVIFGLTAGNSKRILIPQKMFENKQTRGLT